MPQDLELYCVTVAIIFYAKGVAYSALGRIMSLHGLHECLARLGRTAEAELIRQQRDIASASADITIGVSCYCRRTTFEEPRAVSCCASESNSSLTGEIV